MDLLIVQLSFVAAITGIAINVVHRFELEGAAEYVAHITIALWLHIIILIFASSH
jgi:hypothetical protein